MLQTKLTQQPKSTGKPSGPTGHRRAVPADDAGQIVCGRRRDNERLARSFASEDRAWTDPEEGDRRRSDGPGREGQDHRVSRSPDGVSCSETRPTSWQIQPVDATASASASDG